MAKGFGSQQSPDFTHRQKAYFKLIKKLLNSPGGREMKVLRKHAHLLDAGLIEAMEMVAQIMANKGDISSAYFLSNLANWLVAELELYRDDPLATDNVIRPPAFLSAILWAIAQNLSNPEAIYPLLAANLDQLNDNFYEEFREWIYLGLLNNHSITKEIRLVGLNLMVFCPLLGQFPLGNRAINLEIAITGLEAIANIFNREQFPEIWAHIQTSLAPAYRHRIRGNRAENQEKAIAACNNGLLIYTLDNFPEHWARLQNNLGLVYIDRITGEKADNLEKAIACYETALKVVNRDQLYELWGTLQNNLGNAYLYRIKGNEEQNLEKAIACYQVALQVRTRSASPYYWASSQLNLGCAYSQRILGNKQKNLEKAIAAYINALEVYTQSDYPERWAGAKSSLGNAYLEIGQILEALDCLRVALQVFTPSNFPRDCIKTALSLANAAIGTDRKSEAFEAYSIAIEAVEQNRRWSSISQPQEIEVYTKMVIFCLVNGERNKAKRYAERSGFPEVLKLLDNREFQQTYSGVEFLGQILQAVNNNDEPEVIYQILENNLNQLDEQLVYHLQMSEYTLQMMTSWQGIEIASAIVNFSNLIRQFKKGDQAINLKIAVTGYEVATTVFTQKDFPKEWGNIQDAIREILIMQIVEKLSKNRENSQAISPLLQANKHKLDQRFATVFRSCATAMLSKAPPEDVKKVIAASIVGLSLLIHEFEQGNETNNLEIAITGYEVASNVLTREAFPEQWGVCQTMLGNAYHRRIKGEIAENLEQSITYLNNALQVCKHEEFPEYWALIQSNLVIAYGFRIHGDQAENAELAINAGEVAMEVYTRDQFPEAWAQIQNNLGIVYRDRIIGDKAENLEKAITCYQNALLIRTLESFPELWAQTQFNLGSAYRQRLKGDPAENLENAIAANQAALKVYTKEAYPLDWAGVQTNLGNVYLHRINGDKNNNLEKAKSSHQLALQVFTKEEFPRRWAMTQMNLGNVLIQQDQTEEAITCYRSALKVFTPTAFPVECLNTGRALGTTAFIIGDFAEAMKGYSIAIEALETLRVWSMSESRRQEILANSIDVYENMIQCCINSHKLDKAVEYLERSRAKQLVDFIVSNHLYADGEISPEIPELLQNFEALQEKINYELGQYYNSSNSNDNEISKNQSHRAAIQSYNETIAELEADKQQIWEQLRRLDPVLAGQIQVSPIEFSSIQQLINHPTTAILSFYISSNDTHIFVIQQNKISLHTCTELGLETFQQAILTQWLGQYVDNQETWKEKFIDLTIELAELLELNDLIARHLKNISELIIIPHQALHQIPFAALPIAENQYLGDKFLIRYVPSCKILEFCHNRPSINPIINYGIVEDATEDLPYANWEGEKLATLYNIPNHQHLKGRQQASISNYRKLLQTVQVIHSSHHAQSRLDNPLESALILADGRITLSQLLTPSWRNSQLEDVFLSCCETGLSQPEITEDILTFSTAFLCMGAKSVISTLWSVNDLATALFSLFYYQYRHQKYNRLESIKKAQFELRTLTGETLATIYKPQLINFLKQKQEENNKLRKESKRQRDIYPQNSQLYEQSDQEYKKYDQIGNKIYQAKKDLDSFCRESQPFSHPFYWAAFTCSGLN
jgi:Uncharacterized protein conserved in bacteria